MQVGEDALKEERETQEKVGQLLGMRRLPVTDNEGRVIAQRRFRKKVPGKDIFVENYFEDAVLAVTDYVIKQHNYNKKKKEEARKKSASQDVEMSEAVNDENEKLKAKIAELERCLGDLRRWSDRVQPDLTYITDYFAARSAKQA
jgi:uncharacterized protein YlxW (UPF0749 family)